MRSSSSSSHQHPSGKINIAASAKRVEVDNRISLRYYYRISDNILKQADIFREEKNIIDLYVMLLRYSSLVSETIPRHREYRASLQSQKNYLKKKLLNALTELEELKPIVQRTINELAVKHANQVYAQGNNNQKMLEQPSNGNKSYAIHNGVKSLRPAVGAYAYQGREASWLSEVKPAGDQFQKLSLSYPRPKVETLSRHSILGPNGLYGQWQPPKIEKQVETLSRHSILGPNGLYGQWQPPKIEKQVQYPNMLIDLSPVEIPSLQHSVENAVPVKTESTTEAFEARPVLVSEHSNAESETSIASSNQTPKINNQTCNATEQTPANDNNLRQAAELPSMISFDTEIPIQPDIVRQPSPPAILAEVKDLMPAAPPQAAEANDQMDISSPADIIRSGSPLQLHISTTMMDNFMKLAKSNTDKNLETCGVLAGSLKHRKFYVTALIIPKQECTSNTCQTTNEEDIFEAQDKRSLFPLGWIHTHPTQSCFMSSVDVHTHYSYQIMLPEAVAIVMAPQDTSRKHGIFRLTAPGGMSVIRHCQQRGFHHHDQPEDGGPIYKACTDVYMNPNLKFEVIDLR